MDTGGKTLYKYSVYLCLPVVPDTTTKFTEDKKMETKKNPQEKKDGAHTAFTEPITNLFASGFEDVVKLIKKPWHLIWVNFMIGLARGLGFFLGMTILGALVLVVLHKMVDMPLIGKYIADIITAVKQQLAQLPRG